MVATVYGSIVRVDPQGLMYFKADDTLYVCQFDKVAGYRGETAKEFGIEAGGSVRAEVDGEKVRTVWLV